MNQYEVALTAKRWGSSEAFTVRRFKVSALSESDAKVIALDKAASSLLEVKSVISVKGV